MKKHNSSEEDKEFIKSIIKNSPPPDVNYELLKKVKRLANTLCLYTDLKKQKVQNIENLEENLKSYEGFLDKKYWNAVDLMLIIMVIGEGKAHTVEEAVVLIESRGRNK